MYSLASLEARSLRSVPLVWTEGLCSLQGSGGGRAPCLSVSQGCWASLAGGCTFLISASVFTWLSPLLSYHTLLCLSLIRTPVIAFGASLLIHNDLFISRSLTSLHLQRPFFFFGHVRWHSQTPGLKTCISFWVSFFQPTTAGRHHRLFIICGL